MIYKYGSTSLTLLVVNIIHAVFVSGECTSAAGNVTKKAYKPVKEYSGKYWLDDIKEELTLQHNRVILKRDVERRVKRAAAVKRKNKDQEMTKKRPQRTTRIRTSKIWIIKTTASTTLKPLKHNDSLRKCHRRKLMNIALGRKKIKLEEWVDHPDDRKIYQDIMKPWNVLDGPRSPSRRIKKRLNRVNKLNASQVLITTHLGWNYTMSLWNFKKQKPSYLVEWNVSRFQIYNTSIDAKGLHQGRLSLHETAKNPNLTLFDLWWNDTERNLDTQIRTISLNRSYVYRVKYLRRQDREHRPTYIEKKNARLCLLKYYVGTTPGEIIPTRYYNKALLKGRQTPIKILSKKILAKQKKERMKRINKERRRRRILVKMGFKVTNIPTPSSTKKMSKIRRKDPLLNANLSFFERDLTDEAFMDMSMMMDSQFDKVYNLDNQDYEVVDITTRAAGHRKQKTAATTEFYDENSPTTPKISTTMKRSRQKMGLEKKLLKEREGKMDSNQERFAREMEEGKHKGEKD
ncbi:hypothetical protein WDU94_002275 [Cyamophila willieti]